MRFHFQVLALTASVTIACSHNPPQLTRVCTLIGCTSGTIVHLAALPSGPFRIEVRFPDSEDVASIYECGPATACRQDVFFPELVAYHLFITVKAGGSSRETEVFDIHYESSHPNGPDCPPDCRRAVITAPIPA